MGKGGDVDASFLLSDFGDEILCRIISLLPTAKEAVRTGLLSKRWQHLWLFAPCLAFYEEDFPDRSTFTDFVERTLLLRGSSSVETFCLSVMSDLRTTRINSWVTAIVWRKVQELDLQLLHRDGLEQPGVLPSCLFRCDSLVRLKLDMPHDLILPSSVRLSSLKELDLVELRFVDSASVQNLFAAPALESVSIRDCQWANLNNVTISAPNLQTFTVLDYRYSDPDDRCQVVIKGRNLKLFSYEGELNYGYSAVGSSSFDKAEVNVNQGPQDVSAGMYWSTMLRGLYNVRSLTLSGEILKSVSGEGDSFEDLPICCNMTELKLDMQRLIMSDFKMLARLLRKCPFLTKLEIEGFCSFSRCDLSRVLEPVPPCFGSHLKKIVVRPFSPTKVNLYCVALLLRKAMVLESMVICYGEKVKKTYKVAYLKKLPRGSKNCEISVIV